MPRPTVPSARAARRRAAREAGAAPLDAAGLRRRVAAARLTGPDGRTGRAGSCSPGSTQGSRAA
ncbi:hypothetical protein [uncultured Jannaschia sp.]|uniref:hypothetical protein n=1 Tax=uncultured Jannaschia sp. TaxID=293347 RepID=UPI00262654A3|nr:hypothetical protein [uncultured Jannaschia sp.]